MYLARSNIGAGVLVGVSVAVGKGVTVAVGLGGAVGVLVGAGAIDEQEEKMSAKRKRLEGAVLFRMGCILPLVA